MRQAIAISIYLCLTLGFAHISLAQTWRRLVPLHSTRVDVKNLLGRPLFEEKRPIDTYDVKEGRLNIMYVLQRCEQGLPADWGNWDVPPGTVANVEISLKKSIRLVNLKIPNVEKYKWYTDDAGFTYYRIERDGIEYEVENGKVTSIVYGPSEKDKALICKDAPKIKY